MLGPLRFSHTQRNRLQINAATAPWLLDHSVNGAPVLPGVAVAFGINGRNGHGDQ